MPASSRSAKVTLGSPEDMRRIIHRRRFGLQSDDDLRYTLFVEDRRRSRSRPAVPKPSARRVPCDAPPTRGRGFDPASGVGKDQRGGVRKRHDSTEVDLTTDLFVGSEFEARKRASSRSRVSVRCRRCILARDVPPDAGGIANRTQIGRRQQPPRRPEGSTRPRIRRDRRTRRFRTRPSEDASGPGRSGRRMSLDRRSGRFAESLASATRAATRSNRPPGPVSPAARP